MVVQVSDEPAAKVVAREEVMLLASIRLVVMDELHRLGDALQESRPVLVRLARAVHLLHLSGYLARFCPNVKTGGLD